MSFVFCILDAAPNPNKKYLSLYTKKKDNAFAVVLPDKPKKVQVQSITYN
jgi:hypothetical protein